MVVTLGQQYSIGEKPTFILYTYINRHAGTHQKNTIAVVSVKYNQSVTSSGRASPAALFVRSSHTVPGINYYGNDVRGEKL